MNPPRGWKAGLAGCLMLWACLAFAQDRERLRQAFIEWRTGYVLHLTGQYERAIEHYRRSIEAHPTAEAHTFLGWSLSHLGKLEEAIAECRTAIRLDPDFGNPYNDIGVYLIGLGRPDEAVPWLEKAIAARRYCCYHYPYTNLGRLRLEQGRVAEAERLLRRALEFEPGYAPALEALELIGAKKPKEL